jgi:CubicO group peptidase (beta-lactamase class C family)
LPYLSKWPLALVICLVGCEQSSTQVVLNINREADSMPDVPELDMFIWNKLDEAHAPGLAAAIVKDGKVAWAGGYGWANLHRRTPVTPDTVFMLASVSKTITATALMQVWEEGVFELDDDVNDVLDFSVENPDHPGPITYRQLLTHTSSIRDNWAILVDSYVEGDSEIELGDYLADYLDPSGENYNARFNWVNHPPETVLRYSNEGSALAGYLVEALTGTPFDLHCEDHIFAPLEMTETSWHLEGLDVSNVATPYRGEAGNYRPMEHYGYPDYPNGQLRTSAVQLGRFLAAYMENGVYDGQRILDGATVEEMFEIQYPSISDTQGLMWYYDDWGDMVTVGHNGSDSGVSTDMYYRPADGVGIIVLANGQLRANPMWDIERALFAAAAEL